MLKFIIVGTPRSGTTLLARLATELDGVALSAETHFFPGVLRHVPPNSWPASGRELRRLLEQVNAAIGNRSTAFEIDRVWDALGGECNRTVELFDAIVRSRTEPAPVYGEKTPHHLLWWRPLTEALPELRVIAAVRDPRAVVASNLQVPWGMARVPVLAEQWSADVSIIQHARQTLGERFQLQRFEDMVRDPDATRTRLGAFLSVDVGARGGGPNPHAEVLLQPFEIWKQRVTGAIDPSRVDAWKETLPHRSQRMVERICGREMTEMGYHPDARGADQASWIPIADQFRRLKLRFSRRRRLRTIESTDL